MLSSFSRTISHAKGDQTSRLIEKKSGREERSACCASGRHGHQASLTLLCLQAFQIAFRFLPHYKHDRGKILTVTLLPLVLRIHRHTLYTPLYIATLRLVSLLAPSAASSARSISSIASSPLGLFLSSALIADPASVRPCSVSNAWLIS